MSFLDNRKPWCTQRLSQLSLIKLKYVLQGLEEYHFPTPGEIENCAYLQARNADMYMSLVAKVIYDIMHMKKNIRNVDKAALIKFFDELRYGKKDNTEDVLFFDRSGYLEDSDLYFDRRKYQAPHQSKNLPHEVKAKKVQQSRPLSCGTSAKKVVNDHHVSFPSEPQEPRVEDDIGSNASSSSHESELAQLDEAISHIKTSSFSAEALVAKLRSKYSNDIQLSHKVKMKIHCLLELLEDFDCYDELLKNTV